MVTWKSLQQVTLAQFRGMFRNWWALMFNMVVPLAFLLVFGALYGTPGASTTTSMNVMAYLMPGELAFMLLNANVVGLLATIVLRRQRGLFRHLFSTPLSMGVWLTAQILANLCLALVQCAVIIGAGMLWFGAHLPQHLLQTLAVLVISTLAVSGIGLAAASFFKTVEAAQPVGVILSMSLAFLGNSMMPLDSAGATLQKISSLMPSSYITHALRLVMMEGQGLGQVSLDLLGLLVWAAVGIAFGAWQLRRQTSAA